MINLLGNGCGGEDDVIQATAYRVITASFDFSMHCHFFSLAMIA
jgi:hypothetical protein